MTNKEMQDELDAFGDHLPVKLDIGPSREESKYVAVDVYTATVDGETTVVIAPAE